MFKFEALNLNEAGERRKGAVRWARTAGGLSESHPKVSY